MYIKIKDRERYRESEMRKKGEVATSRNRSQAARKRWRNTSPEARAAIAEKQREAKKRWWDTLTAEERKAVGKRVSLGIRKAAAHEHKTENRE
jgi:hypothetical protein